MPEPDTELAEVETLEQALARNWSGSEEESEEDAPISESDDVAADVEAVSEVEESDEDALQPLEKWNDEQKAMFSSLTREGQKFVLDRNHDVESYLTKQTQELAETRKRYERLDDVLKPYQDAARQSGMDLAPVVSQALQYYSAFTRDPAGTLKALAQQANVDLSGLESFDDVDPSIRELRSELQTARQEIAELRGQSTTTAQSQLDSFKSATNEDGTPKHPHFDTLRTQMAPLVANGKSLEDAYNEVLWTLPDYRQSQLEAQRKQALKELETKRAEKARKAKTKTSLPPSDVDAGTSMPKLNGNWETALKHTLTKLE